MRYKQRKNHVCTRCNKLMYPAKQGSSLNHKKQYCSDGALQKARSVEVRINGQTIKVVDEAPPYPQPEGVFVGGTEFHVTRFLAEVSSLYERVVVRQEMLGMQDLALASLLHQRTLVVPASASNQRPMALFKLYHALTVKGCPPHFLVEYEGVRYLLMDNLADTQLGGILDGGDGGSN